jgi:hypothetical protein
MKPSPAYIITAAVAVIVAGCSRLPELAAKGPTCTHWVEMEGCQTLCCCCYWCGCCCWCGCADLLQPCVCACVLVATHCHPSITGPPVQVCQCCNQQAQLHAAEAGQDAAGPTRQRLQGQHSGRGGGMRHQCSLSKRRRNSLAMHCSSSNDSAYIYTHNIHTCQQHRSTQAGTHNCALPVTGRYLDKAHTHLHQCCRWLHT